MEIRPLLKKAFQLTQPIKNGSAIDFGIGGGDETSYLLHKGYSVIAIDNFEEFLTEVKLREDTQDHLAKITTIHKNFEHLEWSIIPQVDLFLASYSLCFIQPSHFHRVFENILSNIRPGGLFVGHLYTHLLLNSQEDGYFTSETEDYFPFLTELEIKGLFKGWDIMYFADARILYNEPIDVIQENMIYSVIAKKQA